MSNGWIVRNATAEDILRFICSDPRFYVSPARTREESMHQRFVLVDVDGKTYEVAGFNFDPEHWILGGAESEWIMGAEGGGPAPWRDFRTVPCPIDRTLKFKDDTCPVCGGVKSHFNIVAHHPIMRFLEQGK